MMTIKWNGSLRIEIVHTGFGTRPLCKRKKTIIHDQICTQLGIYKIWSKINYEEDEIDEPLFKIRLINFIANPAFCQIFNWKKNKQEETEFVHIAHSNAYLMENKHKSIILYPFSLPLSKQKRQFIIHAFVHNWFYNHYIDDSFNSIKINRIVTHVPIYRTILS